MIYDFPKTASLRLCELILNLPVHVSPLLQGKCRRKLPKSLALTTCTFKNVFP